MAPAPLPQTSIASPVFERRLASDGTAYFEQGDGEPLVLIHGVGMRLEAWTPQIEALSRTHRVIVVDMPGHGHSAPLPVGSDLPVFVQWFATFLNAIGLDRVNVAGHSMGALVSGGVVATFPRRILRVALLNGVFCRDEAARRAVEARADSIETHGIDIEGPVERWFDDDEASRQPRALTRTWLMAMDRHAYATAYRAFAGGDATYADAWAGVTCPALFLTGGGDPNSTPEMARQMAALAPAGVAHVIEGHRHMVNLTAPHVVNRLLHQWLDIKESGV